MEMLADRCCEDNHGTYIFELKPEGGAQDDREKRKPAQSVACVFWEAEEGVLDEGDPDCLDGPRDDRVGDEPEGDDGDERPSKEGLHNPSVAGRAEDRGRYPPGEDEGGESGQAHAAHKGSVAAECERRGLIFVRATADYVGLDVTTT